MSLRSAVGILVAIVAFCIYVATLAPGLSWMHNGADGGDLAAAVVVSGVPHPPGYPTYLLLGQLFALIPVGDVAYRLNLMSAVCAAGAAGLLYSLVVHECNELEHTGLRELVATAVALVFAFSPMFWSQAVITEVYALNALFAAALLLLARARPQSGLLRCFLLGLGMGNHLTLVLLLPALLTTRGGPAWWSVGQGGKTGRGIVESVLAAILGLSVYLLLPVWALHDPPINWGDASTLSGFLWTISGAPYHAYLFGLPLADVPGRLAAWAELLIRQFGLPGVALLLLGLVDRLTADSAPGDKADVAATDASLERHHGWGLAASFALYSIYAVGYHTRDSYLYMMPAYLLAALWLGRGLSKIVAWLVWRAKRSIRSTPHLYALTGAVAIVTVSFPLAQVMGNWSASDASHDRRAQEYMDAVLRSVPDGGIVITGSDEHTFALWYQVAIDDRDIVVIDRDLTQFSWYRRQIEKRLPELIALPDSVEPAAYVGELIEQVRSRRAVFLADEDTVLQAQFCWRADGVLWRLRQEIQGER